MVQKSIAKGLQPASNPAGQLSWPREKLHRSHLEATALQHAFDLRCSRCLSCLRIADGSLLRCWLILYIRSESVYECKKMVNPLLIWHHFSQLPALKCHDGLHIMSSPRTPQRKWRNQAVNHAVSTASGMASAVLMQRSAKACTDMHSNDSMQKKTQFTSCSEGNTHGLTASTSSPHGPNA